MKTSTVLVVGAAAAVGAFFVFNKDANASSGGGRGLPRLPPGWSPPGDSQVTHPALQNVGTLTKITWTQPATEGGQQAGTLELVYLQNELSTFAATFTPEGTQQAAPLAKGETPLSGTLLQGLVAGVI